MTDLDTLFLTHPRTLTDEQFLELVREEQRRRSVFHSEEAAKAAKSAQKGPKLATPKVPPKPLSEVDLTDL